MVILKSLLNVIRGSEVHFIPVPVELYNEFACRYRSPHGVRRMVNEFAIAIGETEGS